jgi:predicted dehydrogenase
MPHGIGIVGFGVQGERMLAALTAHPAFRVMVVVDPSAAAAARLRAVDPGLRFSTQVDLALGHKDVSCVYVAAPPASHAALAHAAFDRGKAVFVEKPLTVSDREAKALVERCEFERHKAAVNFSLASSPAFRRIADSVAQGEIGRIVRISIDVAFAEWPRPWQTAGPWLSGRREGGFVREVVSHFLFATRRLVGPMTVEESTVSYPDDEAGAETDIMAELSAEGIPVYLNGRVGDTPEADVNLWTVVGERGAWRIQNWYGLARREAGNWQPVALGDIHALRLQSRNAQLDDLARMLDAQPHRLPSLRESWEVQQAVEGVL